MTNLNIINQSSAIILILLLSSIFLLVGIYYSKKFRGLDNYLVANRSIGTFSLTTSLVASALGAWILFGPSSAATWGGIGAVIGYSLGTAFPLFILIYLGEKFRKSYPKGKSIIEIVRLRFGSNLYKLILVFSIFYMTIFLIAEVTAVAFLIKYISGTELWITAFIVIACSLIYTLYGGLRASLITDNIQFFVFVALLIICLLSIISMDGNNYSFEIIKKNKPNLLSTSYIPNYTAGLTFFIAVAATNLFHQGNWQRVYAAKNYKVLRKSLIISFAIIIPIVFFMGFSGLVAVSQNPKVIPDLAFFSLLLRENLVVFSIVVIVLAISLTISSIDTLINAISSLIIVDLDKIIKLKNNNKSTSKQFVIFLSIIAFFVASKGFSILYLFLIADLFCCAAVLSVFYTFYSKSYDEKNAYVSIIVGLIAGLLFFPSPDFSQSILIGMIIPTDIAPSFISQSLLFCSFVVATLSPMVAWKLK